MIQAFSRTNRIFDDKKHFGHIITFQRPQAFKEAVDNALKLYSNGGENEVLAPSWEEEKRNFLKAWAEFKGQVTDFEEEGVALEQAQTAQLRKVAKAYQSLTSIRPRSASTQSTIRKRSIEKAASANSQLEAYLGLYQNILAEIKSRDPEVGSEDELDIHYELESIQVDEINYAYILTLIQGLIEQGQSQEKNLALKIERQWIAIFRALRRPIQILPRSSLNCGERYKSIQKAIVVSLSQIFWIR